METSITALLVMAGDRRIPFVEHLEAWSVEVLPVSNCKQARRMLQTRPAIQVVITDDVLPDGNWCNVLEEVAQARVNAEVIVCTRLGDVELWLEVLQRGAYDLLVAPYRSEEVRTVVQGAADRSRARSLAASS